MKYLRLLFRITMCLLAGAYIALIFTLDNTRVQERIAATVAEQLETFLGSKVEVGSVSIGLFNAVEIHDVKLYDKSDSTLLKSNLIYGKLKLLPLLRGQVYLRNIAVLDADISLYKEAPDSALNIQFLIDAFKTDRQRRPLNLAINSLILRRCQLAYDEHLVPESADSRFNPHHVLTSDLNANLSLKLLTDDSLNVRVRQLSFQEKSGFTLRNLRLHLVANRTRAELSNFNLELPHSYIRQESIAASYDFNDRKKFLHSLRTKADLRHIHLFPADFAAFLPQLQEWDKAFDLTACINMRDKAEIAIEGLSISNPANELKLQADGLVRLTEDNRLLSAAADIEDFNVTSKLIASIFECVVKRDEPQAVFALGNLNFKGKLLCQGNEVQKLSGTFSSALGQLKTDVSRRNDEVTADLSSADMNLSLLKDNKFMPTSLSFETHAKALLAKTVSAEQKPVFSLKQAMADLLVKSVVINGIQYDNITALANLQQNLATLHLTSNNEAAGLEANVSGVLDAEKPWAALPHDLALNLQVDHLSPSRLQLTDRYGRGTFAFKAAANLTSLELKNLAGKFTVNNFTLNGDQPNFDDYVLRHFEIEAQPSHSGNHITLNSDFAHFAYNGPIDTKRLKDIAIRTINTMQKDVIEQAESESNEVEDPDESIHFVLGVKNLEIFQRLLGINIRNEGNIYAKGSLSTDGRNLSLDVSAPYLAFGKVDIHDVSLYARCKDGNLNMLGKVGKQMKKGNLQAELEAISEDGQLLTNFKWAETTTGNYYGELSASTHFDVPKKDASENEKETFGLRTVIHPTTMHLKDSIWNIAHGIVDYHDNRVVIDNINISHNEQRLNINGIYDKASEDSITIDINKVNIEYIFELAHINVVEFAGLATGKAYVRQLPNGHPWASATVNVPELRFNHAFMGNGTVTLGWDHAKRDITLDGDIREAGFGSTQVLGFVDPINRDLDLTIQADRTQLGFIEKYTEGIFSDITGRGTGFCRVYGGFTTVQFGGHVTGECRATIPITGCTYNITDADLNFEPEAFVFNHAVIRDDWNGLGEVKGVLRHKFIKDMNYDFQLSGENLRVYDKPRELDMPFFAKITGGGDVHIYGSPGQMHADMKVASCPGSELTYIIDSPDADVSQLLTIRDTTKKEEPKVQVEIPVGYGIYANPDAPKTDIDLYFDVQVDNQSCLHLITDDKSGDVITVYGSGPIQARYHNKAGFSMTGTYNVDRGTYGLNIPMLAMRKKFEILPGGKVNFSGDPTQAEVDVKAQYVVNSASLADLNIGSSFANNTTRVNCLINMTGEVTNMKIDLDFDLPNVSEEEKMMVRNLIASDEDRTMQVLYLLGIGRFYAYNYTSNDIGQSQSMLMMNSLLSSTLSSQLNNIISNAIGSSNWTFGTNISTGQMGWNDTEVEGLVSSRLLNNRLLINGNFGYSNRQAATTNFVGDFDMQYLITPNGNVSVRAYSETNDRYFTKSMLTTQGVGLQLKRDFSRLSTLFRRKSKHKH